MKSVESERLVELAPLYFRAVEALESATNARRWLFFPNQALGGKTPFKVATTEPGAREVENVLGRIEHGIFS